MANIIQIIQSFNCCLTLAFMLVSSSDNSSTLMMEAKDTCETAVHFQRVKRRYIPQDRRNSS
jgi:hypothetical protein